MLSLDSIRSKSFIKQATIWLLEIIIKEYNSIKKKRNVAKGEQNIFSCSKNISMRNQIKIRKKYIFCYCLYKKIYFFILNGVVDTYFIQFATSRIDKNG